MCNEPFMSSGDELHSWVSAHRDQRRGEVLLANGSTAWSNLTWWVFVRNSLSGVQSHFYR